jgi:hypothetical protein
MGRDFTGYALQYGCFLLEAAVIVFAFRSRQSRRLAGPVTYVGSLLAAGAGRAYVLYRYGLSSPQYGYFYWTTDILLVLAAFGVVCAFFRRASAQQKNMWAFLRVMLAGVFFVVLGVSLLSLSRNYSHLLTYFIIEFGQNLYFTCLVLITLLYILMQQLGSTDDELGILVCGMGIQFAGPAASLALYHLTAGESFARSLGGFVIPGCTAAMLVIWLYGVARMPKAASDATRESALQGAVALGDSSHT